MFDMLCASCNIPVGCVRWGSLSLYSEYVFEAVFFFLKEEIEKQCERDRRKRHFCINNTSRVLSRVLEVPIGVLFLVTVPRTLLFAVLEIHYDNQKQNN